MNKTLAFVFVLLALTFARRSLMVQTEGPHDKDMPKKSNPSNPFTDRKLSN
jgi:hypothetical protein